MRRLETFDGTSMPQAIVSLHHFAVQPSMQALLRAKRCAPIGQVQFGMLPYSLSKTRGIDDASVWPGNARGVCGVWAGSMVGMGASVFPGGRAVIAFARKNCRTQVVYGSVVPRLFSCFYPVRRARLAACGCVEPG